MNWRIISKSQTNKPTSGVYSQWKPILAKEGFHQCVYCTISETDFGGIRNFHVEHYRPKGLSRFKHLENDFDNLFYSCSICNSFKSDDWPNDPSVKYDIDCYPDPSIHDYNELFVVDPLAFTINGVNVTGSYILHKLYLNRPQLVINRRELGVEQKYRDIIAVVKSQKRELFSLVKGGNATALSYLVQLEESVDKLEAIFHSKKDSLPYTTEQTKRP